MKKNILLFSLAFVASLLVGCTDDSDSTSTGDDDEVTLKDKENVNGLKLLYSYGHKSEQVEWEEIALSEKLEEYYYYDRGNSTDNKVVLFNPDNYTELNEQSRMRKSVKRAEEGSEGTENEESEYEEDGTHKQFLGALTQEEFFALSSKLDSAVSGAKKLNGSYKETYDYVYFEMDAGYKSIDQQIEYKMYENDYLTNDIHATKLVATDETYAEHEEVEEHSKEVITNQTINGKNYLVDIMHVYGSELDEDGKYKVPENYREMNLNPNKLKISDVFSFPMNSGLKNALTSQYFETMDKKAEWLSSSKDEKENITLKYNHDLTFEDGSQYAGQGIKEEIYATLSKENKMLGYGYKLSFTYYGAELQTIEMNYVYDYQSVGNLVLTEEDQEAFDYNKYYDFGTLVPYLDAGNLSDEEAEKLLNDVNDCLILDSLNQPTGVVAQDYKYYKTQNNGETVEVESLYHQDSTLYNDNVLITYFSEQGVELDSTYYAESGTIQEFNKDNNNYKIREYNGESRYNNGKITTSGNQQISLLDEDIIREMTSYFNRSKSAGSGITAKISASLVEAGVDPETNEYVEEHYVIQIKAATQEAVDSDGYIIPACMYEFEIGFQIIK